MTKLNYTDVRALTEEFCELSFKDRGSYSYACGTFQSMLCGLVSELPKHKQMEFVAHLKANTTALARTMEPA